MQQIWEVAVLWAVTLIPPLILMVRVYTQDQMEKESLRLLAKLFAGGGASVFFALAFEYPGRQLLEKFVTWDSPVYWFLSCFLLVGWIEELGKFCFLRSFTWENPQFNYRFDAIVYSVFVAMGFALVENFFYVAATGSLGAALGRGLTAIPGHGAFGVFMGYYYGTARQYHQAAQNCANPVAAKRCFRKYRQYLVRSIALPALLHGCYDLCLQVEQWEVTVVFVLFIFVLDLVAVYQVQRGSQCDGPIGQ